MCTSDFAEVINLPSSWIDLAVTGCVFCVFMCATFFEEHLTSEYRTNKKTDNESRGQKYVCPV